MAVWIWKSSLRDITENLDDGTEVISVNERPAFSVCMCTYHGDDPAWFRQAVESILNQTVPPDEVVLVVDGPVSSKLEEEILKFEGLDSFCVLRLQENQGLGNARRAGLAHCSHDLVAMMDSDDISVSDRFERQLSVFLEDPQVSIVGGQIAEFVSDPDRVIGIREVCCSDAAIRKDLKVRCPFNHVTVMLKRSDVEKVGGYLDWFYNEDYYLWVRMCLAGFRFVNVPQVLVNVRVGEEMYQRRGGWKYFCSEYKLQNYMLLNKVIGLGTYALNVAKRVCVQLLLPNGMRSWVFQKFARKTHLQ